MGRQNISTSKYYIELSWLRGLAAILIVLYHYTVRYNQMIGDLRRTSWECTIGYGAVNIFFLLSAFLTVDHLKNDDSALSYIKKRFIRLYPTYWLCMILSFVVCKYTIPELAVPLSVFIVNFSMLQGFVGIEGVDGAYWTLACELRFYILITLILLLKKVKHLQYFSFLWVFYGLLTVLCSSMNISGVWLKAFNFVLMPDYIGAFAGGVFIALIKKEKSLLINWIGLAGAMVVSFFRQSGVQFKFLVFGCLFILEVIFFHEKNIKMKNFVKAMKPLEILGGISFPLYLLHQNIGYAIIKHLDNCRLNHNVSVCITICVAISISAIVHYYGEVPMTKWFKGMIKK